MAIVYGTDLPETLNASDGVTNGGDSIFGFGGNDSIFGLGGDDTLAGGAGADHLDGGAGSNEASYLSSQWGVRVSLAAGAGFHGDAEGDTLVNIERLFGSNDDDILVGNGSANALQGNKGDDILKGGGGADHLYGIAGYDTLQGAAGADLLHGGGGFDTATYNDSDERVFVSLLDNTGHFGDAQGDTLNGIENLTGSPYDDALWGNADANTLKGLAGKDTLKGYGGADKLYGGHAADKLYGMDGMDTLRGEAGDDTLTGGPEFDTLIGGPGNDTYVVSNADEAVVEYAGQGTDKLLASKSYWLQAGDSIETLATTNLNGTAPIILSGNELAQTIRGNAGDNHLDGKGGADTMAGYEGDDWYYVDNAGDAIAEKAGPGSADRVLTSVSYTLGVGDKIEIFTTAHQAGLDAINLTGNEYDNAIHGNFGSNTLNGQLGNDTLIGDDGTDSFLFDTTLNGTTNFDEVVGFAPSNDVIVLDNDVFSGISTGVLAPGRFHIGAAATTAGQRIIYNAETGVLFHDADGTGATDKVRFAFVDAGLAMDNADVLVVA